MARKVEVLLVDDIDGGKADSTLEFAFDGANYEIDLTEENIAKFREAVAPYIEHARRVRGKRGARKTAASGSSKGSAGEVRRWAAEHGYKVSPRGRIPGEVMAAFLAAN